MNGYLDCYLYECKGRARFSFPVDIYQVHITKFFREKGSDLDEPVSQVLVGFRDAPGFKLVDKYAQPVKGRHGFYDGTYWKQISALGGKAEQLGFVEGYLWCHAHESGNKGGTFSKAPAEYEALITRWYGFVPDTGDVNAERESTPIAEALLRFRDHPEGPKPGSK